MTDYGVTPQGFSKKNLSVITEEINTSLKDNVNSKLNLLATSVLGQIIGIFGDKLRELWDVDEAVYRSMYPDSASNASLDEVASITGAVRLAQTKSEVTLDRLYLDSGTTLSVGQIVGVGTNGNRFVTIEAVSNATGYPGTFSAAAQAQEFGEKAGPAGNIDTIDTPVSGWNAKAALTNTVNETYSLDGLSLAIAIDKEVGTQLVAFSGGNPWTATSASAQIANTITGGTAYAVGTKIRVASDTDGEGSAVEIRGGTANAVLQFPTGVISGFNSEDASLGRDVELDPAFRTRREQLLRITGAASVEALRSAVRDLTGILQAIVIENVTNLTDANGLPPHSFEAIAQQAVWTAAEEQAVGDTLWLNKAAGIKAYGTETTVVTDSMGFDHDIGWSKPTEIPIYMALTMTTDDDYPSDGDVQVAQALADYGNALLTGEDVIALQFKAVPLTIAGVVDVTTFRIDTISPATGTTNITIGVREQATFATTNIVIPAP
jgi:uncharacterized phage protein gp47/JayE